MTPQRTITGWDENRLKYRETKCLTPGIRLEDYRITQYGCGNNLDMVSTLNWSHFDFVSLIGKSKNPKNGQVGYWFVATRNEVPTVVVGEKIM
jgi:hypothetical protein